MFVEREYQTNAEGAIVEQWKTVQSTLLELATGLGKTRVACSLIQRMNPKRTLFLAHQDELIVQAVEAIQSSTGLKVDIEKADLYASTNILHRAPVVVSSIQSQCSGPADGRRYRRFNPKDFGLLVVDECFIPGTLVDGRRIETLRPGNLIRTHQGTGHVRTVFKTPCHKLITLRFSNGRSITSTPNHPFWTQRGFVKAIDLTNEDMVLTITPYEQMCDLPQASQKQTMRIAELHLGIKSQKNTKHFQEAWRGNNQISKNQWNEQAGSEGPCGNQTKSKGMACYSQENGERKWSNITTTGDFGCTGVEHGIGHSNKTTQRKWLSDLLQSGCWKFRFENRRGGGWVFSRDISTALTRQEERFVFEFTGLESFKIHQRGGFGEFEQLCPEGFVYNLEVSNGNTYFANGILVHNCHHGTSPTWQEVIKYYRSNPDLKMLGLSATPKRGDDQALSQVIDSVAFRYGILDGVRDGWLVDIAQQYVMVKSLDFSEITTRAGDFNKVELSKLMEREENVQGLCQPTIESVWGLAPKTLSTVPVDSWKAYLAALNKKPRRTLVFTVSVAQAEMCASVFGRCMDGVEWVCGQTNKEDRKKIRERFLRGETHVVCNCGVYLEGYNNPYVELISVSRPTKSVNLYTQMLGRGTRTLPGVVDDIPDPDIRKHLIAESAKPILRVLDFVGNSGKHKLVSAVDVLGGHVTPEAADLARQNAMKDGTPKRILVTMTNAEAELEQRRRELADKIRQQEEARKAGLLMRSNYSVQDVNPFDHNHVKIPLHSRNSKDGKFFSEKQAAILMKGGINPQRVAYRQGQAIIGKLLIKPTEAQIRTLTHVGRYRDGMTRDECSKSIDAIAKEKGWKQKAA